MGEATEAEVGADTDTDAGRSGDCDFVEIVVRMQKNSGSFALKDVGQGTFE